MIPLHKIQNGADSSSISVINQPSQSISDRKRHTRARNLDTNYPARQSLLLHRARMHQYSVQDSEIRSRGDDVCFRMRGEFCQLEVRKEFEDECRSDWRWFRELDK